MSKKTVIKADLVGKACMSDILSAVSTLQGIKSMDIDADKCTLTVVGTVDPVRIARKLKKKCFAASIMSVADDKPDEKPKPPADDTPKPPEKTKDDPCKEACEKACKEACERRCKAWLESGCGGCCTHCAVPSYPYYCYPYSGWPYGC